MNTLISIIAAYIVVFLPSINDAVLTFDDGPHLNTTPKILDTLKKYGVKATFCIPVYNLHDRRKLRIVKRIISEGHTLCNHSMTHGLFNRMSDRKQEWEILKAQSEFKRILGVTPKYFRPPGGVITSTMRYVLRVNKIKMLYWNVSTEDWRRTTSKQDIIRRAVNGWKNRKEKGKRTIILFHDTNRKTASVIEQIILKIKHEK